MPEVSIIVPVYKVESYLRRCVDSILGQTFSDFELILVDDGSPDNCPEICDQYAETDSRIRVIHKQNGGLSSARNAGLDIAVGNHILFCDSDDYVPPDWVALMLHPIQKSPLSYVVCNLYKVINKSPQIAVSQTQLPNHSVSYFDIYKLGISGYVCNKIYNRAIVEANNIRFDESCRFAEDVPFNAKYFAHCDRIIYIPQPLYYYDQRDGSIMHKYNPELLSAHLAPFYVRIPFIEKQYMNDYCDINLYMFIQMLENVFDSQCTWGFLKKLSYNQKIVNTEEFQYCLTHASGKNENPIILKLLRKHNYYLYWLFNKICELKARLLG